VRLRPTEAGIAPIAAYTWLIWLLLRATMHHGGQGYFQEFETGGYRQKFGGGCKHARKANLHLKTEKTQKK